MAANAAAPGVGSAPTVVKLDAAAHKKSTSAGSDTLPGDTKHAGDPVQVVRTKAINAPTHLNPCARSATSVFSAHIHTRTFVAWVNASPHSRGTSATGG